MTIETWLFMVAFAYGIGVFWYELLPGHLPGALWRVAAYPFAAIVLSEAFINFGPSVLGFHVGSAAIAALVGVIIDWLVTSFRHATLAKPEARGTPAHA